MTRRIIAVIVLGSPVAKIFVWVISDKCAGRLTTGNLQYGFKRKSATSACPFAVMEIVNWSKSRARLRPVYH